jgi:hypothetical protein
MCMGMGMCVSMDVSFLLVLSHFILSFSLPPSAPSPLLSSVKVLQRVQFGSPIIGICSTVKQEGRDLVYNSNNTSNNNSVLNSAYNSSDALNIEGINIGNNPVLYNSRRIERTRDINSTTHLQHVFVCTVGRNYDELYVLKMVPILSQVRKIPI